MKNVKLTEEFNIYPLFKKNPKIKNLFLINLYVNL